MRSLAVIPARYGSTRFEGKPLAKILGREMVLWVCQAVEDSLLFDKTIVATDDERIYDVVAQHGFNAMMTEKYHNNGTQRCEQVLRELEKENGNEEGNYDIVVNVQGDEPMICREQLKTLLNIFEQNPQTQIATLMKSIDDEAVLLSPNVVKVVAGRYRALYFSRSVIPFVRGNKAMKENILAGFYHKHIGLYAYRSQILHQLVGLKPSLLEQAESLEQLRWLENGYEIGITSTVYDSVGIDTEEDLQQLNNKLLLENTK